MDSPKTYLIWGAAAAALIATVASSFTRSS